MACTFTSTFFLSSIYHWDFLQTTEEMKFMVEPGAHSAERRHGAALHPQAAASFTEGTGKL